MKIEEIATRNPYKKADVEYMWRSSDPSNKIKGKPESVEGEFEFNPEDLDDDERLIHTHPEQSKTQMDALPSLPDLQTVADTREQFKSSEILSGDYSIIITPIRNNIRIDANLYNKAQNFEQAIEAIKKMGFNVEFN